MPVLRIDWADVEPVDIIQARTAKLEQVPAHMVPERLQPKGVAYGRVRWYEGSRPIRNRAVERIVLAVHAVSPIASVQCWPFANSVDDVVSTTEVVKERGETT